MKWYYKTKVERYSMVVNQFALTIYDNFELVATNLISISRIRRASEILSILVSL